VARLFPEVLPSYIRKDHLRSTECRVYDALAQQLPDEYHIFYSSPFLGTRPDGSEIDGEADFVIGHPRYGLLVVEVKGGRITIDEQGQWRSKDRNGITHRIKNPVNQAMQAKHVLVKKFRKSSAWEGSWVNARHGVILPDVAPDIRDLRPDMPLEIFAFDQDMSRLEDWVRGRFDSREDEDRKQGDLGLTGMRALDDLIARPVQLQVRLSTNIGQDIKEISLLTEEQLLILHDLEDNHRMAIYGAAGTGKTVLACKKASMLEKENQKTLLLCYNAPLGARLKASFDSSRLVTAGNFHEFCKEVFKRAAARTGTDPVNVSGLSRHELAEKLVEKFIDAEMEEFDAVIIDEGQDFSDQWLVALQTVVKDTNRGVLYIFYDDNQNVMSSSADYLSTLPVPRWHLSRNFRNTKKIFRAAEECYRGGFVVPIGPDGDDIRWHENENDSGLHERISERIGDLVHNHSVKEEDIAVLMPDREAARNLAPENRLGPYSVTTATASEENTICLDSIRRFKGLEAAVVLLVLRSDMSDEYELLYTGASRATARLEVFGPRRLLNILGPAIDKAEKNHSGLSDL